MRFATLAAVVLAATSTVAFAQAQPSTNGSNPNSVGGTDVKSALPGSTSHEKARSPDSVRSTTGTTMSTDSSDMRAQTGTDASTTTKKKMKKKPK